MKHNLKKDGYAYRLRPIEMKDASFIIDVRLEDDGRNQFIHKISDDVSIQEKWLSSYFERENDYYFVLENKITSTPEGVISIYNINNDKKTAEWGRWVIKKGSLGAVESVNLINKIAFEDLDLEKIYSKTVADNTSVVSFHDSIGAVRKVDKNEDIELEGRFYKVIEHQITKKNYFNSIEPKLSNKSLKIFEKLIKIAVGKFEFHHIGVATEDIEKEFNIYKFLGYQKDGNEFSDPNQGIRGIFINAKGQPTLELLENLEGVKTLNTCLKNKIKMYHFAYRVGDFDAAVALFTNNNAKLLSRPQKSVAFGNRICFFMLPNMFMIELVESLEGE